MKKLLPFFTAAIVVTACNSNPETITANYPVVTQAPAINPDTVGFAQFQQQKAQNELVIIEEPKQAVQYVAAAPVKKISKPVQQVAKSPVSKPKPKPSPSNSSDNTVAETEGSGEAVSGSTDVAQAPTPAKEGWSKAAKGSVIGGVGGAIAGAVLNKKNRAVGAVLGGVIGAGGGYVIGRGQDKKDGRY